MSLLAVSVQVYARPRIVKRLPPGAFTPPPKVQSAVLRLDPLPEPLLTCDRRQQFFAVARAGFSQKRKTLRNSLSAGLNLTIAQVEAALAQADISPQQRAQELDLPQWLTLTAALSVHGSAGGP